MFYVKPNWNIVYKYLKNKKFFKRLQYPSFPKCITKIFSPKLQEKGMPKKRMDAALQEKSISQVLLKHFIQEQ